MSQKPDIASSNRCPVCGSTGSIIAGGLCGGCLADTAFRFDAEDAADVPDVEGPAAPGRLGAYELLEELGRGGMGVVYRARQRDLDREVALKVIPAGPLADPEFVARFRTEARLAGRLRHPNIVAVHDVGEADGHAFFSMDLVRGPTLAHRLRDRGPLPSREAAMLAAKVAGALHHAHEAGVLHRDVKPSNILLDSSDEPHVADFGLARAPDDPTLTLTNQTMGTPAWLAPEQAAGCAGATSTRTDVYGLGAVLYLSLTGRAPFPGRTVSELLQQVQSRDPAPPRLLDPAIPRDLETITLRCLEKNPARRYGSAREAAEELGRYLSGEPIMARPVGPLARAWRWAQRRRALAAALAALMLVVVVAGVALTILWLRARDAAAAEKTQRQMAQEELWNSLLQTARGQRLSGAADARSKVLATVRRAAALKVTPAVRDEAIAALAMPEIRYVRQVLAPGPAQNPSYPVIIHPTLPLYCLTNPDGGLSLVSLTDGRTVRDLTMPSLTGYAELSFSRGGRWISGREASGAVTVWETETGLPRALPGQRTDACHEVLSTADDTVLALCREESVDFLEMPTGRLVRSIPVDPQWSEIALSPRGTLMAVAADKPAPAPGHEKQGAIELLATGPDSAARKIAEFATPLTVTAMEWSADETLLACALDRGEIRVLDAATGAVLADLHGHDARATQLRFLPGSRLLLSSAWDRTTRLWDVRRSKLLLTHSLSGDLTLSATADTFLMQGAYGDVRESRITLPVVARELIPPPAAGRMIADTSQVSFAVDDAVVFTSGHVRLRAWDTASGALLAEAPGGVSVMALPDNSGVLAATSSGLVRYPFTRDTAGGAPHGTFGAPELWGPLAACNHAALAPDGMIAAVSTDPLDQPDGVRSTVEVWRRGQRLTSWSSGAHYPSLGIDPAGKVVATGGHQTCTLALWSAATGERLSLVAPSEDLAPEYGLGVAIDAAGRQLASISHTHVRIWDLKARRLLFRLPRPGPAPGNAVAFSPDGNLLAASGAHHDIWLIDPRTGHRLAVLEVPASQQPAALTFSHDGRHLAAALTTRSVLLWDLAALRASLNEMGLDW